MAGKMPDIILYVSDKDGKQNFKESTIALWLSDKLDNNGNQFWTGRVSADPKDADRWVAGYKFVPKSSREDQAAKAEPTSSKPKDTQEDVPF